MTGIRAQKDINLVSHHDSLEMALRASINLLAGGGALFVTRVRRVAITKVGVIFIVRSRVVVGQVLLDDLGQGVHEGHVSHDAALRSYLLGDTPCGQSP